MIHQMKHAWLWHCLIMCICKHLKCQSWAPTLNLEPHSCGHARRCPPWLPRFVCQYIEWRVVSLTINDEKQENCTFSIKVRIMAALTYFSRLRLGNVCPTLYLRAYVVKVYCSQVSTLNTALQNLLFTISQFTFMRGDHRLNKPDGRLKLTGKPGYYTKYDIQCHRF
jgi:hypothetical protein